MSVLSHVMRFEQMSKIPDYEKYSDHIPEQLADSYEMSVLSQVMDHEHMTKITSQFQRLGDRCYVDNAGATLYPANLLNTINDDLINNVYMNPHTDKYTKDCIEQIRCLVLKHFNTDPSTYSVIFTSGTTQSLKLVAESFQFSGIEENADCGSFVYLRDNHTSVLGLREIAADRNADIIHISHDDFIESFSVQSTPWKDSNDANTLVVYPAQSNFNGYKYPINCMHKIKNGCLNHYIKKHLCKINCNWYILLDAASYVSTNKMDLSDTQPDFISLSFYKIFGFPTGLGALLVKNSSGNVLSQKRYFGGGTVDALLSDEDYHVKREILHERFEDGTVSFLSILALKHCFDNLNNLVPKIINNDLMDTISHHSFYLAKDLYHQLLLLKHENGTKAVMLYMDSDFHDINQQGSIVTFNLLRENGTYIGYSEFQHMADLFNINVRTGCFCNSGSCQRHLMMTNKDMKEMYKAGHRCGDEVDLIHGRPTGAIRVSFGYFNTFNDVDKLINMICKCFVKTTIPKPKRYSDFNVIETKKASKSIKTSNSIFHKLIHEQSYFRDIKNILNISQTDSKIVLKEISIFPIKSCGAFKIDSAWKIGPKGFEFDRDWMIIKDTGVCLTQKQNPRMCMIRPKIDLKHRVMILTFKGKGPISIPLDISTQGTLKNTSLCHSKVCMDMVKGYDCGDDVADWISEALEVSFLRLVRQAGEDNRAQKKKNSEEQKLLSLSNQAQFLLINKATVRWLSKQIQDPIFTDDVEKLTDRFRGNLIIDMDDELAERDWQKVFIGKHEFKVEGQCPRCQMICIDQQTGEKTVEPLRTISEQFGGKLRFGIYLSYAGTVDGSNDSILDVYAPIKTKADDDISR